MDVDAVDDERRVSPNFFGSSVMTICVVSIAFRANGGLLVWPNLNMPQTIWWHTYGDAPSTALLTRNIKRFFSNDEQMAGHTTYQKRETDHRDKPGLKKR